MSAREEQKTLEVHACSPRPHFVPVPSHIRLESSSLSPIKYRTFSPSISLLRSLLTNRTRISLFNHVPFLSLSFSYVFSFFLSPLSFLGLRLKELFVAALLFANLRRVYIRRRASPSIAIVPSRASRAVKHRYIYRGILHNADARYCGDLRRADIYIHAHPLTTALSRAKTD